jgi:hypothetical protein
LTAHLRRALGRTTRPVALAGRVPVEASAVNGPIRAGDLLTTSATPGVAMRATRPGPVIGMALDGLRAGRGRVVVFVDRDPGGAVSGSAAAAARSEVVRLKRRVTTLEERLTRLERRMAARR